MKILKVILIIACFAGSFKTYCPKIDGVWYNGIYVQNLTPESVHVKIMRGGTVIAADTIIEPYGRLGINDCSGSVNIKVVASDSSQGLNEKAGNYQFWDHDGDHDGRARVLGVEGDCGCVQFWILRKDPIFGHDGWTTWEGSDGKTKKGQFIVTHGHIDIHDLPASDGRAKYGAGGYYFFQDSRPISKAGPAIRNFCMGQV